MAKTSGKKIFFTDSEIRTKIENIRWELKLCSYVKILPVTSFVSSIFVWYENIFFSPFSCTNHSFCILNFVLN